MNDTNANLSPLSEAEMELAKVRIPLRVQQWERGILDDAELACLFRYGVLPPYLASVKLTA